MKYNTKLLLIPLLCIGTFSPIYAEDNDLGSQITDVSGTDTSSMNAELKYEVLPRVIFKFGSSKIVFDDLHVGDLVKEPEIPQKEGYKFIGWFDVETGEKWDFSKPVTKQMTLEARFEKINNSIEKATKKDAVNTASYIDLAFPLMEMLFAISGIIIIRKRKNYAQ